jgi:hypothetical protein|tara:strand:+ start:260 stop:652 length:393 start_codon:yes stop_codon:yes gene_type:complete
MATKNNFTLNQNYELSGHEVTILAVDFINTMASEVNDASDGTALGGIMLVRHAFAQEGVMILSEGPLTNSGTEKNFLVRKDSLDTLSSTTTIAALQARLRTLDQSSDSFPNITADITGATVTEKELSVAV